MKIDAGLAQALEPSFWIELATEYDAENFCEYLRERQASGTLNLGSMFSRFESLWRRDELNHTHGFFRIYSTLYGIDEKDLLARLRNRRPSFSAIEQFLADEFAVCLVLAYDEIATTKSYQRDMIERYPKFGHKPLVDWIRLVARDEAWHFENALSVIKEEHAHRISEVPKFLDELINFEGHGEEYGATFILDHSANDYDISMLASCRSAILNRLNI